MALVPSFNDFAKAYEAGENQVVYTRLAADLDTPVSLMLKLTGAQKDAFVLESVTGGEIRGRYSIIGMKPDLIWRSEGETASLNRMARYDSDAFVAMEQAPLDALRALIAESHIDLPADLPQAAAGLFGYLGYDMIRHVEHLPDVNPDVLGVPDAIMLRPSVVAVLDGVKGEVTVVSPAWVSDGQSARAAYAQAGERVMDAVRDLERPMPAATRDLGDAQDAPAPVSNFTHEGYLSAVDKAKEYIKAGDIFQVVPSQRWCQEFKQPPFALYRSLRRTNPSPFMFYFNFGGFQVVGASPEILVRVFGNEVTIRPIAGTRKRGATPEEDNALEADLLADEKELAEHLMLLDLGRNDVGKVAKIGTVRPTEEFIVERYSHVMHIVSNVVGELHEDEDALSAFFAGMPAGTVSGAPKVRAMEIIDELEPEKRGIYGGGCGYFSAGGDMDMCIALRTAVVKDEKLYIQAGGGVVYDSDPEAEYMETVHKSGAIRKAAEDASRFTGNGNS
ncbi:anthranilate synthase component I [Planktotalea frisia]|jgi:anthranilate synthase component 1|uniref:Anthranilate synthase component 1 n=1 Tax=Planktotalea frisia TaxID=696762 RepID=A0A1L9NY35_9RHOB|nr:anthranilate synthase component I [Planktotalea frisia]OJI94169.1 anthranilate synthase component 1 [Planktotalea frisia]PZX29636.1 anthranilate synthase component I [Planktotalea frisia]